MDEDLATRLLDALESVYTENVALKGIMRAFRRDLPPQYQIDQWLARAKGDPLVGGRVHEQFEPLRARVCDAGTLEQVLQEFLRVVPAK
jgi:hypothetical protein